MAQSVNELSPAHYCHVRPDCATTAETVQLLHSTTWRNFICSSTWSRFTVDSTRLLLLRSRQNPEPSCKYLRFLDYYMQKKTQKDTGKMRFFCLMLVLYTLCNHVLADQIFPAHLGSTFSRSSREPKYKIEFHPEDSPFHPDYDQESVVMPNKNGQNYLCFLPKVEKAKSGKPVSQLNMSSMIVETEKRVKLKTPDELLEVLKGSCFIRQEGWWSYEFCYQKKLRQFHVEDEKVVQEFILGVYDEEATAAFNQNLSDISTLKDPRSKDASQRYHAHQYTNGTSCDLTNQPRETEVRFVCSEPRAMISSITELSTCKYALTVQCPMLCKHPLFQEERPVWHTINCNVLPKDNKETKLEKDETEDKQIIMVTDMEHPSNYDSDE